MRARADHDRRTTSLPAGDPMGLINAIGNPIAATTGLETFLSLYAVSTLLSEI
jgi:hypothetical protein